MYNPKKDNDVIIELLEIRNFEKKLLELFDKGKINGTTHTCIGQEEVPVSVIKNIKEGDFIFSNHRGHGHYLAKFHDMEGLFCEIIGKDGAVCNGVGGSQHIKRDNYFSTGIQGESVPVGVGVASHLKFNNKKNIALAFIGDGTWGQGAVYEALNMASLWQVPFVLICENNGISQTTDSKLNLSSSIKKRADAFELDYLLIQDELTVDQINKYLEPAIKKVRNNFKPLVVEFKTNRLASHSKGDDTRSDQTIKQLIEKDWYEKLKKHYPEHLVQLELKVKNKIDKIIEDILSRDNVKPVELKKSFNSENILNNKFVIEKVLNNLNRSISLLMRESNNSYFIGEDILDPYGGAFKVSKGLSTEFPERVITTPISELGLAGVANGLALCGNKIIVEFMFADFVFLAFDQIINFAAKTTTMYGESLDHSILFRCPVGGHRGYGATHSQSVQKFFIGIPNLNLFELSPLHDFTNILPEIMNSGIPSMLFESKIMYPLNMIDTGTYKKIFHHNKIDKLTSHIYVEKNIDILIICAGSMVYDCLDVMEELFFEEEISAHLINPLKIYPFDYSVISSFLNSSVPVFIVEESNYGGGFSSEISSIININHEHKIKCHCICSSDEIIPSSRHLEEDVLVNKKKIFNTIINNI
jgi:2-oxoisovalerate dehydrogenase E1 component